MLVAARSCLAVADCPVALRQRAAHSRYVTGRAFSLQFLVLKTENNEGCPVPSCYALSSPMHRMKWCNGHGWCVSWVKCALGHMGHDHKRWPIPISAYINCF